MATQSTTRQNNPITAACVPPQSRWRATLGNLLMLAGLYLLLYVGGVYVQIDYQRLAARGDNDLEVPRAVIRAPQEVDIVRIIASNGTGAEPAPFVAPVLSNGQIASAPPALVADQQSTVERIVIPAIALDAKVIEVGWKMIEQNNRQVAVWDVAEYAVGQHRGSANPGEGENIVLAGHVGGYGQVFRDLYYVKPGNRVLIYSGGQEYLYIVSERLIVDEEKAPLEQRAANARLIGPAGQEIVTMVTCWPPNGRDKFTQRIIVRAIPYGSTTTLPRDAPPAATIR